MNARLAVLCCAGVAAVAACDVNFPSPEPCGQVTQLTLELHSLGYDADYAAVFMQVGDSATARVTGRCQNGTLTEVSDYAIHSTVPTVVSVAKGKLHALALGEATVITQATGWFDSATVRVVRVEADSVWITEVYGSAGSERDPLNPPRVTAVTVLLNVSAELFWTAFLNNERVWAPEVVMRSGDSSIAVARHCGGDCPGLTPGWWIMGKRVGQTVVTMEVPGTSATESFVVKVI